MTPDGCVLVVTNPLQPVEQRDLHFSIVQALTFSTRNARDIGPQTETVNQFKFIVVLKFTNFLNFFFRPEFK